MSETTNTIDYDPNDYISVFINIKEREERRRIRELNDKLSANVNHKD